MVSDNVVNDNLDSVRAARDAMAYQAQHDAWKRRWRRFFLFTATLFAVGLAGLAWYTYGIAHNASGSIARLDGVENTMSKLNGEVQSTQAKLGVWDTERDQLKQQLEKTGSDILRRAEGMRKQTGDAMEVMAKKLQASTDGKVAQLQSKLSALESARDQDHTQVASLQKELGQVRGDVAKQGDSLTAVRNEISTGVSNTQRQLAQIKDSGDRLLDSTQRNRQDVDRINNNLNSQALERVNFEVSKGRVTQITPGISFSLTGVDLSYHRVTGWMWVMPDRRTVWLRKQSTQEPVIFYGHDDGKRRELVITDLTKNSMVGYLLLPKGTAGGTVVAAAQ